MAEIRPFRAFHYSVAKFGRDWSALVAPPYDEIDAQSLSELRGRHSCNIVTVDLPHYPPGWAGPEELYLRAAETLREWIAGGVLVQDDQPCVYYYRQRFQHSGQIRERNCLLVALRLERFGEGSVYPHERTFGGPIEDRLRLTQATGFQISPIFGLVSAGTQDLALHMLRTQQPQWYAQLGGVEHEVSVVADDDLVNEITQAARGAKVYIADGHHRYQTALAYQQWLAEREGALPADHPANFLMIALAPMDDPGNLLLPTHRIIKGLDRHRHDEMRALAAEWIEWEPLGKISADQAEAALAADHSRAFVFIVGDPPEAYLARLKIDELPAEVAPGRSAAFRRLPLALLHEWLVEKVVKADLACQVEISYTHDARAAFQAADDAVTAVLVQPCTMEQVIEVCLSGDTMPQKSTYFYPKLITGLALYRACED